MIHGEYGDSFNRDLHMHKKWKGMSSPWRDIAKAAGFFLG